jgi:hypothetical protein
MSGLLIRPLALAVAAALGAACSAGTSSTSARLASPADSAAGYAAPPTDTAPAPDSAAIEADSAMARLGRHVGFRQAIGDATRLGIVTGYSEVRRGRMALMLGPGYSTASTVEYHLKRIYSAYGDYLNHTLAPVLELREGDQVVGDYSWDGLALREKGAQGTR